MQPLNTLICRAQALLVMCSVGEISPTFYNHFYKISHQPAVCLSSSPSWIYQVCLKLDCASLLSLNPQIQLLKNVFPLLMVRDRGPRVDTVWNSPWYLCMPKLLPLKRRQSHWLGLSQKVSFQHAHLLQPLTMSTVRLQGAGLEN